MFVFAHSSVAAKYGATLTGIILFDSLVYMRDHTIEHGVSIVNVAQRLVDNIFARTGIAVTAVYSMPDLWPSFLDPASPLYIDMLKFAVAKLEWTYKLLLVFSMGNDAYLCARGVANSVSSDPSWYKVGEVRDARWYHARWYQDVSEKMCSLIHGGIREFVEYAAMLEFDATIIAYGASASTWRYSGTLARMYDLYVRRIVRDCLELPCPVVLLSGAMNGVPYGRRMDDVGHLDVEVFHKVSDAVVKLVRDLGLARIGKISISKL